MKTEATYAVGGATFRAVAYRHDRPWGRAIDVAIFDAFGQLWATTSFACHPEFDDYETCQLLKTDEMLQVAVKKLADGFHESITPTKDVFIHSFRLNGDTWWGALNRSHDGA